MARYDYQCLTCGEIQEISHPITDPAREELTCRCAPGTQPCRRLIALPAVHYDGWGFYRKDNLPADERYAYKHESRSGIQSELRERDRRIPDPSGDY
jgi:predicted nucleic acid-binding Zn ribbon protein